MKELVFSGAATALITPMNSDGSVNYSRLTSLVNGQISGGIDALVICGTTGEKSTLRHDEHLRVIETAVKAAAGRVPIIAGTGSNDTAYSVELSLAAERLGVDAFLMVTPYYNKTSQSGLIAHYNYIADRVNKPIIIYNVPSRTGMVVRPETYYELSRHERIVAVKEASGNLGLVSQIRYLCGDDLAVYSGNDNLTVPTLSLGGAGVISVLSNILPKVMHDICALYFEGKVKEAADLQIQQTDLMNAMFADISPIPVKTAMNQIGMNVGPCRPPLFQLEKAAQKLLTEALTAHGFM